MRVLLLCTTILIAVSGNASGTEVVVPGASCAAAYADFPSQVFDFLQNATDADRVALVNFFINYAEGMYTSEDEIYDALERTAPGLYESITKVEQEVDDIFNSFLGKEAQDFVTDFVDDFRRIEDWNSMTPEESMNQLNTFIEKYQSLSEAAKAQLDEHFHSFFAFIQNPHVHALWNLVSKGEIDNPIEIFVGLKLATPELYKRIMDLPNAMGVSLGALRQETKDFIMEILVENSWLQFLTISGRISSQKDATAKLFNIVVEKYTAQPETTKADLRKNFPVIMTLLTHEKALEMVKPVMEGKI